MKTTKDNLFSFAPYRDNPLIEALPAPLPEKEVKDLLKNGSTYRLLSTEYHLTVQAGGSEMRMAIRFLCDYFNLGLLVIDDISRLK
jgi:hypothetical protein